MSTEPVVARCWKCKHAYTEAAWRERPAGPEMRLHGRVAVSAKCTCDGGLVPRPLMDVVPRVRGGGDEGPQRGCSHPGVK